MADYLSFCRALLGGGTLGDVRLIGPKTLGLMTSNHLPGGRDLAGNVAFVVFRGDLSRHRLRPWLLRDARSRSNAHSRQRRRIRLGRRGNDLVLDRPGGGTSVIFMTQVLPSTAYPIRRELRTMIYAAITDSNL